MTVLTTIRDSVAQGTQVGASTWSILPVCDLQHRPFNRHLSAMPSIAAFFQPRRVP